MDECGAALAVVSAELDQSWLFFETVLVRSKGEERPCRSGLPPCPKYDRLSLLPWPVYTQSRRVWRGSIRHAQSTTCRCSRADTCPYPTRQGDEPRGAICGS